MKYKTPIDKAKDKAKDKLAKKFAKKGIPMKKSAVSAAVMVAFLFAGMTMTGCASADPASKSQSLRATGDTIVNNNYFTLPTNCTSVTVENNNEIATQASSNDGADTVSPSATASPKVDPQTTAVYAPAAGSTDAITSLAKLGTAALGAATGTSTTTTTATTAATTGTCTDGSCTTGNCTDGSCSK